MHRLPSRLECAAEAAARHVPVNRPCPASAGNAEPRVYPRVRARGVPLLVVATIVLLCARALPAQAIGQGFELERAGQYDQAAAIYLATLRAEPTNLSALLGLERVLPPINRLGDLLPAAQRAAAASPSNVALRGVLLRTYVALNEPDSGRAVALRWAAAAPGDEAPYREWAMALEDAHRPGAARDVLLLGRRALGRPGAFGIELAELSQLAGDWEGAAREWAAALTDAPVQLPNAASALAEAPDAQRERIARLLTEGTPSTLTRRLAGELLLNWGQPLRAWAVFEPSVATPSADAAFAARRFADLAGARSTPDARRARALALARYADLAPEVGGAAARARADAARAFIEAGDRIAARAVLERVAQDSNAPPDAQRLAQRAVVEALIEGGQRNEAAQQLATNARLSADDRASLRLRPVRARIAACGCPPGNGGKWGRGAAGPPAPGRTRGGPARHPATGYRARAVRRSCQHWRAGRSRAGCRARVGPAARTPGADGGRDPTSRAPDSHLSRERGGARGATRAGTGEGGDSAVMKRRNFLKQLSGYVATGLSGDIAARLAPYRSSPLASLLVPMDDAQGDHLKAS